MKICLIVDDYLPDSIKVAAKMMHELAVEFNNQGYEVIVITPSDKIKENSNIFYLDNIKIIQFKTGKIKNTGKIQRAINESLLSIKAWVHLKNILKKNKCDFIVFYSPSIFWSGLVKNLKKLWNVQAYLILRDFFPQWVIDSGMLRENSLITKYFRYFEKKTYNIADTIGIQSPGNLDLFKKLKGNKYNTELLFNWVKDTDKNPVNDYYRKKLNLEDKIIFFYGGNIGHAQDMTQIIRLALNLKDNSKVFFVLIGRGDEENLVRNSIKEFNLNNMILLDPIPQDEFKRLMSEFDIGLFCLNKNHSSHNFPGKILGYLSLGIPVLGSVNPGNDLKHLIEENNAGYVSIAGNEEEFKQNAIKLLEDKERKKCGTNAKKLLKKHFDVKTIALQILNNIIKN